MRNLLNKMLCLKQCYASADSPYFDIRGKWLFCSSFLTKITIVLDNYVHESDKTGKVGIAYIISTTFIADYCLWGIVLYKSNVLS